MFPSRKQSSRNLIMSIGRGRHRSGVNYLNKFIERFCRSRAKSFPDRIAFCKVDIIYRHKFRGRNFRVKPRVVASDMADADDSNAKFFYRHILPLSRHVFQKPIVRLRDTLAERDCRLPAKITQLSDIEKFSRGPVRLGIVPSKLSVETNDITDQLRQFTD